jgi:hypothetical protein
MVAGQGDYHSKRYTFLHLAIVIEIHRIDAS